MRRLAARLAAVALLLGLLPLTAGACNISCACASTPDPNWTPVPVSPQDATAAAAKFAAGSTGTQTSDLAAYMGYASEDPKRPLFAVHGSSVDAIVDAIGDMVIEYVQVDAIPDSPDVAITSADAQAQATSFLSDRDRDTGILLATTTLQSGAASAYVVTWADKSGGAGQISVWVNPSTGTPYAFADQRFGVQFVPPSISAAEAGRLALATVSAPGEVVLSADLQLGFDSATWSVALGTPGAGASAAPDHGAMVDVDAVTGAVTIGKSW